MWAADDKIFHIMLAVFKLTEGKLELLYISVYLFGVLQCVTHISLHHSWKVGITMDYCLHAGIKTKENPFQYFQMLFVLKFLFRNLFSNYFLIMRNPVCFLTHPFCSKKKKGNIILPCWRGWQCLALSLLLYWWEGHTYGLDKDRKLKLLHLSAHGIANARIHHIWCH